MNGKGSKRRPCQSANYAENFDAIFGTWYEWDGGDSGGQIKWVHSSGRAYDADGQSLGTISVLDQSRLHKLNHKPHCIL